MRLEDHARQEKVAIAMPTTALQLWRRSWRSLVLPIREPYRPKVTDSGVLANLAAVRRLRRARVALTNGFIRRPRTG